MPKSVLPRLVSWEDWAARKAAEEDKGSGFDDLDWSYTADYPTGTTLCESDLCREPRNGPFIEIDEVLICQSCLEIANEEDAEEALFLFLSRDDS